MHAPTNTKVLPPPPPAAAAPPPPPPAPPSPRRPPRRRGTAGPLSFLRQHIKWGKMSCNPTLSDDAQKLLSRYYELRRQHEARQGGRTTVCMLEGLVRVTRAHARLMAWLFGHSELFG